MFVGDGWTRNPASASDGHTDSTHGRIRRFPEASEGALKKRDAPVNRSRQRVTRRAIQRQHPAAEGLVPFDTMEGVED